MNQKYICVTGASSGIGQALAMYYRDEREYTLILSARNQKSQQEMQDIFPLAEIYIANFCLQGA
jgi:short-subunit dehydrogenase